MQHINSKHIYLISTAEEQEHKTATEHLYKMDGREILLKAEDGGTSLLLN